MYVKERERECEKVRESRERRRKRIRLLPKCGNVCRVDVHILFVETFSISNGCGSGGRTNQLISLVNALFEACIGILCASYCVYVFSLLSASREHARNQIHNTELMFACSPSREAIDIQRYAK